MESVFSKTQQRDVTDQGFVSFVPVAPSERHTSRVNCLVHSGAGLVSERTLYRGLVGRDKSPFGVRIPDSRDEFRPVPRRRQTLEGSFSAFHRVPTIWLLMLQASWHALLMASRSYFGSSVRMGQVIAERFR